MADYWAKMTHVRDQLMLFSPTLDDMIPEDHAIRQLEAILSSIDWTAWEARYHGSQGQPPIHPRYLAGSILYGLINKVRSSRDLEVATSNRIDFMWFLHGTRIDHSTFARFRVKFRSELKDLSRQINREALTRSLSKLLELAIDGTRIRAYSSRDGARSAERLEKMLGELDTAMAQALEQSAQQDITDDPEGCSTEDLDRELERLKTQQERLQKALEVATSRDATRQAKQGSAAKPGRVPVHDPEAHIQPNKEGGYAPNYTPTAAVDKESGCILDADVVEGNSEASCVLPAVDEIEANYDGKPENVCTDGNLASGAGQEELDRRGITFYAPVDAVPAELSPAARNNPREPIPEEKWHTLPMRGSKQQQLARGAFLYAAEDNCYWCPMGKPLVVQKTRVKHTDEGQIHQTIYGCEDCIGCPLARRCLSGKGKYRTITRDAYEVHREATARRMETDRGKEIYKRRAPIVETVFGHIKAGMGIRQFFHRGLKNVRTEWQWICTAYNLKKLLRLLSVGATKSAG